MRFVHAFAPAGAWKRQHHAEISGRRSGWWSRNEGPEVFSPDEHGVTHSNRRGSRLSGFLVYSKKIWRQSKKSVKQLRWSEIIWAYLDFIWNIAWLFSDNLKIVSNSQLFSAMKALKCTKKCLFHHFQFKESNLFIIYRHIRRISPYISCIPPHFIVYYTVFSVFFCIFKIILIDSHDITHIHAPFTSMLILYIHISHIIHNF